MELVSSSVRSCLLEQVCLDTSAMLFQAFTHKFAAFVWLKLWVHGTSQIQVYDDLLRFFTN